MSLCALWCSIEAVTIRTDAVVTHTYVELEVSDAVYDEIVMKLKNAGYVHVFLDKDQVMVDMHGIALKKYARDRTTKPVCDAGTKPDDSFSITPAGVERSGPGDTG